MKITLTIIFIIIIGLILNFTSYPYFLLLLSVIWYIASIMVLSSSIKNTIKYKFKQLDISAIINGLKSKSHNNITPISSLCTSLAAKIGVGSLSGVALAIYFGGVGTIIWIIIISMITSINTYLECHLGIKYRESINNTFIGGPSYYLKKGLHNPELSTLYSILILISYSILFLSIQANTITSVTNYLGFSTKYTLILLLAIIIIITTKGLNGITKTNSVLVPVMLLIYFGIGILIIINYHRRILSIIALSIKEAFKLKTLITVFLIGMQRAIFITESSLGTSAIASSICDNDPHKQGMLEIFGIYVTIFIVALTTYLIIVTSNYQVINFKNINGIEVVMYAFNYHFGHIGNVVLSIITIMFALSTIISSYYFGMSNLLILSKKKSINIIYKIIFVLVIIISAYIKPINLWNLTDYFIAILLIVNTYALIKIKV